MIRLPLVIAGICAAAISVPLNATSFIKASERPIIMSRDTNLCVEVDATNFAVLVKECGPGSAQTIRLANSHRGAGYFSDYLIGEPGPVVALGRCLTGYAKLAAQVTAERCDGSPAQHWTFSSTNPAFHYTLRNGLGLCMGLPRVVASAPAFMVDCASGPARLWNMTSTESVAHERGAPQRQALAAQQRAKVRADEARWNLLWAKPEASEAEQRELEELAISLDRVTLSTKYETYRGRYLIRNYGQLNRFCEQGYSFACERLGHTSTARAPSGSYSGSGAAPPSASVNVRTYDQYGNYKGTTTTTRTDATLMGAKPR